MAREAQLMEEGYRQALRDACKVITGMLGENFMDSYSGMVMEPPHFEGRRNRITTRAGELTNMSWKTFMAYLEKLLKRAVESGKYDWILEDYKGQIDTRTDIVEANLMAMRRIVSWIDGMDCFYAREYRIFTSALRPQDDEELGDWSIIKRMARDVEDKQPYGDLGEYELFPLLDILQDNPRIFNSAPKGPGLDTLKNMILHIKHNGHAVDEGLTPIDIPGDWYAAYKFLRPIGGAD